MKLWALSFNYFTDPLSPAFSSSFLVFLLSLGLKYWYFPMCVLILYYYYYYSENLLTISSIHLVSVSIYVLTSQTVPQTDSLSFRLINPTTYLTVPLEVMGGRDFPQKILIFQNEIHHPSSSPGHFASLYHSHLL